MYEYQYIEFESGGTFWTSAFGDTPHREIIDREAQKGWRYVGFLPRKFTGHGGIKTMDLIFERPVE